MSMGGLHPADGDQVSLRQLPLIAAIVGRWSENWALEVSRTEWVIALLASPLPGLNCVV